jgi:hypothetical protein
MFKYKIQINKKPAAPNPVAVAAGLGVTIAVLGFGIKFAGEVLHNVIEEMYKNDKKAIDEILDGKETKEETKETKEEETVEAEAEEA